MRGRRGASPNVQRALGWCGGDYDRPRDLVPCPDCGSALEFDVPDPQRLGRSMQRCGNPDCDAHTPHPMIRELL